MKDVFNADHYSQVVTRGPCTLAAACRLGRTGRVDTRSTAAMASPIPTDTPDRPMRKPAVIIPNRAC